MLIYYWKIFKVKYFFHWHLLKIKYYIIYSILQNNLRNMKKYPAFFFWHGSPMNAVLDTEFSRKWWEIWKNLEKPKAIISISAHFETHWSYITAMDKPKTIYDFSGFPLKLYEVEYEMVWSEKIAHEIINEIKDFEILLDYSWWIDHGTWTILKHVFPDIWDIPVLQISIDISKSSKEHFEFAKKLSYLREKWYMIMWSGNIVHNLYKMDWDNENEVYDWVFEVNESVKNMLISWDTDKLLNFRKLWPNFDQAIPTKEHFLPLIYIYALKDESEKLTFFNDKIVNGSLSMTSFQIW